MPANNDIMGRILLPTVACLAFIVVVLMAVNGIAAMAQIRPHVGDIVAFTASVEPGNDDTTRLIVHRPGQFGCVLDIGVLRRTGGSFVIESQITEAQSSYRVHWAGPQTTADTANCGGDTDLILDGRELDVLALGAGGYGTASKRLPVFVNRTGLEGGPG